MEPPWDQVYAGDVPPDFDEMRRREDRKERIKPFWDLIVNDTEPKVNRDSLLRLMHDLKEEGNALFKEGLYDIAWMHYRNAIFVVRILENRFYYTVEKDFTSSLFSNRAFCCLKKTMYKEAVKDCESAIGHHPKNLKAYYRQAQAYKHLGNYKEAYTAAQQGQALQPSSAFKELIEELEPHIKAPPKKATVQVTAKTASAAPVNNHDNNSQPDKEWLAGTNFKVTEKHLQSKDKMPSKKGKKNKKKNQSNFSRPEDPVYREEKEVNGEDTDSSLGVEDDKEFANLLSGVQQNKIGSTSLLNGHSGGGGLDIQAPKVEEESAWSFPHDSDDSADRTRTPKQSRSSMGLDSFSPEVLDNTEFEYGSYSTSSVSSGRTSRSSQSPSKGSFSTPKHSSSTPSPVPEPIPPIIFPLPEYEFKLACGQCFSKIGEGTKGYRYVVATHSCTRNVLIVKKKNVTAINWLKIRGRPDTKAHGAYKICQQFTLGKPCKVGEDKCTFPHHQAEASLWTMDRDGFFSISDFVNKCRTYQINDSNCLESMKSKQQYIPGLHYVGNSKKKSTQVNAQKNSENGFKNEAPKQDPATFNLRAPNPVAEVLTPVKGNDVSGPASKTFQIGRQPPSTQTIQQNRFMPPVVTMPQQVYAYAYPPSSLHQDPFFTSFSLPPPPLPNHQQWVREVPTVLQPSETYSNDTTMTVKLENPLSTTHKSLLACSQCFKPGQYPGVYSYLPITHKCEETVLGMKQMDNSAHWVRIRERKNHREFKGNYILCRAITYKNIIFCKYGEENCSFAHNNEEQFLWTLEKDGKFNITEFIVQNRKQTGNKGFSLQEILSKHGGCFEFICRSCYYGSPPQISTKGSDSKCAGTPPHDWKTFETMAHKGPNGVLIINPRGFLHKTAFFKICKWLQFCRSKVNAECRFAHSMIERDVWMLERDSGLDRATLVEQAKQMTRQESTQAIKPSTSSIARPTTGKDIPATAATQVVFSETAGVESDGLCPFVIVEVCETCLKKGQKILQDSNKDRCQRGHANWSRNIVFLLHPSNKELRPLPKKIPAGLNFIVCKYIREGNSKCGFKGPGPCQFAHSTEELDAWRYMCTQNPPMTQAQLSEASRAAQKTRAESAKVKISGQSVVAVQQGSLGVASSVRPVMPVANIHTYYCQYCGISCNSQKQWDEHCASEKHNFNVNSDKEHQWNYRQPPWTTGHNYELCAKHLEGHKCQYSNVPEMYNLCRYAHSQDELDEWEERFEWRQMKREMARQEKVFSYMDQLLEKYENSQSSIKVISEEMDGVEIKTKGDLNLYKDEKNASFTWTFDIKSVKQLLRVALFYNRDRLHFSLSIGSGRGCQIAPGEVFSTNIGHKGQLCYKVNVKFTGGMFGSFQQWVLFDFGEEPVLCRKLNVEIGTQASHEKVRNLRKQLKFDRWTGQNREILRHEINDGIDESLLSKYKEPTSSETVVTQTTVSTELNRHNYVAKMHKMLELEEMTRHQIISSYNLCATIECLNAIEEEVHVYAKPGELFAKVPLQEYLTEDTDAGKLILTSVRKVLLAPQSDSSKKVYEASIVREENFNYDGRGREYIYLCISPNCVRQLGLTPKKTLSVEIQFQMDRLFFCRMHYAVDKLMSTDVVFPDVPKINPLRNEKHNLRITSTVLNPDQLSAVRHIVAQRVGYTPPFIMYGPFGTGKTETIAQATMVLLKETKDTRILICTQSNSAADLYIVKHFDVYLKKLGLTDKLRRIYFKERRVYTVAPEVKKYCLLTRDEDSFDIPTKEDIMKHRIVIVTVTTSLLLTGLGLHDCFTHIFVDEAAQTLECESLMPLSLATDKTCIVLAGDRMQTGPKVYSSEARNQSFHQSLLERLYNYYESNASLISETSPLNILLSINYRTKMEILRFISAVFYGGPDMLKSEANIKSVLSITPLIFHTVQGREVQDENSITYYNMSEVQEIVLRVDEMYENWPEEWGQQSAKEIGVVTPYFDQVQLIRKALKKKNPALRDVNVERVQGIQGREFRAMFISTVRTRHLIEANHVQTGALTEIEGDGGDFGFLSDDKLLNTALTRAQSVVVVVGDPVALCAIGDCVNVWRTYLKHCQNMSSLYPQDHNFDSIRQQVQNLLNSPAHEKLLEIAREKSEQKTGVTTKQAVGHPPKQPVISYSNIASQKDLGNGEPQRDSGHIATQKESVKNSPAVDDQRIQQPSQPIQPTNGQNFKKAPLGGALGLGLKRPTPLASLHQKLQKPAEDYMEVGCDYSLEADDVIGQLTKKVSGGHTSSVQVQEQKGHAVLYCDTNNISGNIDSRAPDNLPVKQLISLLTDQKQYAHCIVHVDTDSWYADTVSGQKVRIQIHSRLLCGQANHGDEVVVKYKHTDSGVSGRVVGVLKAAVDLTCKNIVCEASEDGGRMMPINTGLSPMFNLITSAQLEGKGDHCVAVYRITKSKQVRFHNYEQLHPGSLNEKLFVVRYLKWHSSVQLPLCIVVGVVPSKPDIQAALTVLDLEYNVPRATTIRGSTAREEVEYLYPSSYDVLSLCSDQHVDLRASWCFTIEQTGVQAVGRAFSIDENQDGTYQVGVHVADVASFVPKNSSIDIEALKTGTSLIPCTGQALSLLPARLSENLCSLRPNVDRLAISFLMKVQSTGEVTEMTQYKSIINCKKQYSYTEAEEVLHDPLAHEDYLKSCILVLYEISRIWRKERLGNAAVCEDVDQYGKVGVFTRQIVQEMVIKAEARVAELLIDSFPYTTPLYIQTSPNKHTLSVWKQQHAADAINSVALTKPFLDEVELETCKCCLACTHTVNYVVQNSIVKRDQIEVFTVLWDALNMAVTVGDHNLMQNIIVAANNHPQLAVARSKLESIETQAKYQCSADVPVDERYHYTINRSPYTCITDPLNCYIDIIVQRLLCALDSLTSPYSHADIKAICGQITAAVRRKKQYEADVLCVRVSSALLSHPLVSQPVVQMLNPDIMSLCFPNLPVISGDQCRLVHSQLGICEAPLVKSDGSVVLKWQERVYDVAVQHTQKPVGSQNGELNPDRFIYKISPFQWQRLLIAIREQNEQLRDQKLNAAVEIVRKQVSNPALENNYITEVTSEGYYSREIRHFTQFTLSLRQAQALRVQLSAELVKGTLTPCIQLLNLTPRLDICLQHRTHVQQCFVGDIVNTVNMESVSICQDMDTYTDLWRPVTNLESVSNAVASNNSIIIHNVQMVWENKSGTSTACFQLSVSFMKERKIKFRNDRQLRELFQSSNSKLCRAHFSDFVCIRYSGIDLLPDKSLPEEIAMMLSADGPCVWVGHGAITRATLEKDQIKFYVKLQHSDIPLPPNLYSRHEFTVELISRTQKDMHINYALEIAADGSRLMKDIVLRHNISAKLNLKDVDQLKQMYRKSIVALNQQQEDALTAALSQPLACINGVVGSGKSVLAAKLAIMFSQRNRMAGGNTKQQVLLCASSESTLHVLNDYLLSDPSCPNVVLVYSCDTERLMYPLPRDITRPADLQHNYNIDQLKMYNSNTLLHNKVRNMKSETGRALTEFDNLFSLYPGDISEVQFEEYLQLVISAEARVIRDADIILCTCTTSGSNKLVNHANVKQIIIDDACACTEPESLVPLSIHRGAQQVTLLGDTAQLQPTVVNKTAAAVGLNTSLLNSYIATAHKLTVQYRMHEGIVEFPSANRYKSMILCGSMSQKQPSVLQWPGGRARPTAFCQLDSQEESVNLSGVDSAGHQTICNSEQASIAVRMALSLVTRYRVASTSILIMSATDAQAVLIQQLLAQRGSNIQSLTVTHAQGKEYDYVIYNTVRSLPQQRIEGYFSSTWKHQHLATLTDSGLTTVALTRAKKGLIIIGNQHLLECDEMWKCLLRHYEQFNLLVPVHSFLQTMSL